MLLEFAPNLEEDALVLFQTWILQRLQDTIFVDCFENARHVRLPVQHTTPKIPGLAPDGPARRE